MPKKKSKKKTYSADFTINDSANSAKPVSRVKKSVVTETLPEKSWEDLVVDQDDVDILEEVNKDGTKNFISRKYNTKKSDSENEVQGIEYPEIVWYLISPYIKPEQIGNFARINKATYSITKRESFWRALYKRYCMYHPNLPNELRIENSYKLYGLRQRVIRGLYHTYDVFMKKILQQATQESSPHQLVKRRCVNVWYCKAHSYWFIYFKLKKSNIEQRFKTLDFIEELGRIDANPEEDSQVLQVTCQNFYQVPPLMGMTLSSVSVVLSQGFRHHRLHLGFNTGHYNISGNIMPECSVVIDTVVNMLVYDWWHPKYPNFENRLPVNYMDEESLPMLKTDFFTSCNRDI